MLANARSGLAVVEARRSLSVWIADADSHSGERMLALRDSSARLRAGPTRLSRRSTDELYRPRGISAAKYA
jgi:hypothetical protein